MSDEAPVEEETTPEMPVEVQPSAPAKSENVAPGLSLAFKPPEVSEDAPRRRRGVGVDPMEALRNWQPLTRLGRAVLSGEVVTMEQALRSGMPIREVQVVDALLPNLEEEIIKVNMVQRMTDSGRRVRFNVMACVGNKDGYVGLSICKGKEVAATIHKAIINAKINILREQKLLPDLPKKIVRPKIIVGLEALGRASDRIRLLQFMQDLAGTLGADVLARHINLDDAIKKFAIANGVDTQGLLKDQEQIQQEQQQAQQQQLAQQALADPRVAIEAGRHITDNGKGLALNNETGDVSVENME